MGKIILFSEMRDTSTTKIMKWVLLKNIEVERINIDDENLSIKLLCKESIILNTSFGEIILKNDDFYWFRRATYYSFYVLPDLDSDVRQVRIFELQEKKSVFESIIYWILNNCNYSSNPFYSVVSKTDVLDKALKCGLTVPQWMISSSKNELMCFMEKHGSIAIKTFNTLFYIKDNNSFKNLTNRINHGDDINKIPNTFPSTFFQKYIEKKYELRVFYFHDNFFTMAIMSQNDDQTKIDFRDYNKDKPNRIFPFLLPVHYAAKLKDLAQILNLDTGSFDILVDVNDQYYFLEVNPVGQFGMVSLPCNYNIEKHIAETLISFLQNSKNEKNR